MIGFDGSVCGANVMKHLMAPSLVLIVLAAGLCGPARAAQPGGLAGEYVMRGRGLAPYDSAYEGTCSLRGDGPVYEVSCFNKATRHTYAGLGLSVGDTLSITIGDMLRGDHGGVFAGEYLVVYKRGPNGLLEGTWTATRGGSVGTETLTPIRRAPDNAGHSQ
jgi:hypothetical protein